MEPSGQICCLRIHSIKEDEPDDQGTSPPTIVTRHHRVAMSLAVTVALSSVELIQTGRCLRLCDPAPYGIFCFIASGQYRLRTVSAAKEELDVAGSQRSHQSTDREMGF